MTSEKSALGKKSRLKGQKFEAKVRQNLEEMGWIVSKWMNTVDLEKSSKIGKLALVSARRKYNPFFRALSIGNGFPDFVCFRRKETGDCEVIGLEVKANGYLDKTEKGICMLLLENKIFSRILIAKNSKERGKIEYIDFNVKYNKR